LWGGVSRLDLTCEVPSLCGTVVSIVLIGPVGSPSPFSPPSLSLLGRGRLFSPSPSRGRHLSSSLSRGGLLVPPLSKGGLFASPCGMGRHPPSPQTGGRCWTPPPFRGGGPPCGYSHLPLFLAPPRHQGRRWTPHPYWGGGSAWGRHLCHPPPKRGMTEA